MEIVIGVISFVEVAGVGIIIGCKDTKETSSWDVYKDVT